MNKGISPLISGVLLIAFTLAVAAIVSGWLTSVTRTTTEKVETGISEQVECTNAKLKIIKVDTAGDYVIIHNTGIVNLTGFVVACNNTVIHKESDAANTGEFLKLTGIACDSGKVVVASIQCPAASDRCTIGDDCPT